MILPLVLLLLAHFLGCALIDWSENWLGSRLSISRVAHFVELLSVFKSAINFYIRIPDHVDEFDRSESVPCLTSLIADLFSSSLAHLSILLAWSLMEHFNHDLWKLFLCFQLDDCVVFDSPIFQLFLEEVLLTLTLELWPQFPLIPEIVDHHLENLPISIHKHLVINLLQSVQTTEHFLQG